MDRPDSDPELLAEDLENLARINRRFDGLNALRRSLPPLLRRVDSAKTVEIVDLATGSADYPIDLARRLRRAGRRVNIVAVDKNPFIAGAARRMTADFPEITVQEADIRSLPYADRSFDIALCSSAIHHFSREDAVRVLKEMDRVSRVGWIVNDLNRTRAGAWAAWLYTHAVTRNPITRYDAYHSMRRAFRMEELREMALEAGIRSFNIRKQGFLRLVITAERG